MKAPDRIHAVCEHIAKHFKENVEPAGLKAQGVSIDAVLRDNDAYNALKRVDGLVMTGPTGTNVNDVAVALIRPVAASNR